MGAELVSITERVHNSVRMNHYNTEQTDHMPSETIAKTVFLSSGLTIVLVIGLLFVFRNPLVDWMLGDRVLETVASETSVLVSENEQLMDMVELANEAVVSVVATRDVPIFEQYLEEIDPFGGFFGGGFAVPRVREQGTEEREVGGGSGFIVSSDGLVVTNRHVVADEQARYSVLLVDGRQYSVDVLAKDPVLDVAVLRIETDANETASFASLTFGDSDAVRLGQVVVAIGNALAEFNNTVSVGVVSGLARSIVARDRMGVMEQLDQVIQTDAAINLGNSGGPLLDISGNVIGMNVAASLGADNIGFALPSNAVAQIVRSVQETGEIVRPFLGVRHTTVNPQIAALEELGVEYGALVLRGEGGEVAVLPDSPADRAGIREGDVIITIGERSLESVSLAQALRNYAVGETISIMVWRDNDEVVLEATLVAAP